ncbi:N-acetylglucosamine/diacetylchitobiose ABC transporter substrate-binding protein [Spongiactinospora sp. TRM90649]|uniref:N-acetylglucosamine/diacetylchitobiose ABC transporter substrate-binding protein n=1 Tax=Spongiactinospora sp. TRM90649 TaxID=3031114 RepID=UPI0023F9BA94|nr:N-acetylglucosamine/diacetylchitobiose ABC transporter substrate-binding protein [Spongiactinospora sp. TRM90649]MDF5757236.1 N-acetylglucosamine/diacetylchitobiose ABC transporter substrate-binding protein [Spongiactinospora sp. TRM90649]
MSSSADINRRALLRRIGLTAFVAGPGAGLLAGCATAGSGSGASASPAASAPASGLANAANPFSVQANAPLEVVIFSGGYTDAYATKIHEPLYKKKYAQATIKHTATQRIGTQLRPRFVSGEAPDVVNNSGSDPLDLVALQGEGHLADLTALFDAPSVDDPAKKVKDTLTGGVLENALVAGKPHVLNYTVSHRGLWYNAKLFAEKGWQPPTTWDAFLALCEQIKGAGITPFAYPGQVGPFYQTWNILYTAAKIGGNQVILDIDNLVDGAWTKDAVIKAVSVWVDLQKQFGDKAYFGLDHTQTQLKQLQGKVAFYPTGSWLENEMQKEIPDDFEYAVMPIPAVTGGDVMPAEAFFVGVGENFFVSARGKNPLGGLEYLRLMLSKEGARGFTQETKNLTVVNGSAEGVDLPPGLKSAAKVQDAAGQNIITDARYEGWYKKLYDYSQAQTNSVMAGRITPQQFAENMQKKADETKNDKRITKQTRTV